MDPSPKQISDLFSIVAQPTEIGEGTNTHRIGKDAEESAAMGRVSLNDGDYDAAIRHFQRALEQKGEPDPNLIMDLGAAYELTDQAPQALRQFLKARQLKADSAETLVGLADVYKGVGRFDQTIAQLQEAANVEPMNPLPSLKLAEALRESGRRKQALVAIQEAILRKPTDAFFHYWCGDLLLEMKRDDEALDSLRAAIEISPGDDHLYLKASVGFWRRGRHPEAIKAVRLASDLAPEKDLYYGLLEALLTHSGQTAEAALETERAEKMDQYDIERLEKILIDMGIAE